MQATVPRDSPTYISRRRETKRIGPADRPRPMPAGPLRIAEHDSEYTSLPPTLVYTYPRIVGFSRRVTRITRQTRMWANAQRDGRPAEYR